MNNARLVTQYEIYYLYIPYRGKIEWIPGKIFDSLEEAEKSMKENPTIYRREVLIVTRVYQDDTLVLEKRHNKLTPVEFFSFLEM